MQTQMDMRPRPLDLYCCGGGAAVGYDRAGFRVTGIDKHPQKRYPFEFIQADAIAYLLAHWREFDAVHASPPCQRWTALRNMPHAKQHDDLIEPTRDALDATGLPYVIENVVGAPLLSPVLLCGTMFKLRTECGAELRRHRLFETNWLLMSDLVCNHYATDAPCTISVHGHSGGKSTRDAGNVHLPGGTRRTICVNGTGLPLSGGRTISVHGDHPRDPSIARQNRTVSVAGHTAWSTMPKGRTITVTGNTAQQNTERNLRRESFTVEAARVAMGIPWLTMRELSQAIPPAYTEFIGHQLLQVVAYR